METPTASALVPDEVAPARFGWSGAMALTVLVGCELMLMLVSTVLNVALPAIQEGLDFSPAGLAWVPNAFLLAFGGLLLLGGRAGDVLGRRRVFLGGIAVFTVASLLGGLAREQEWLVAMRALQGVGAALAGPSTLALITTRFQGAQQARALGVYSSVTAAAMTLGLVLGGLIVTALPWNWAMLVNVPIGLLIVALTPAYVAEAPRHPGPLDLAGALTSALGATGIVYGLGSAAESGWAAVLTWLPLAVGVVALAAFVLVERRVAHPLVPLGLFGDPGRTGAYLGLLLVPMVVMSMQFLLVQLLQGVWGFSPLAAGLAFVPWAAGMFLATRGTARLLATIGARGTATTGGILILCSTLWLTQLSPGSTYLEGVAGPVLLAGTGLGLVVVPFNVAIMSTVPEEVSGAASGVLQAAMMIGASLGVAILATVSSAVTGAGGPGDSEVVVRGMRAAFAVSSLIAALSLVLTFVLMGPRLRRGAPG